MIIKKSVLAKLHPIKCSDIELFSDTIKRFNPHKCHCPVCCAKGQCNRIVTHYDFRGLNSTEVSAYVAHKLRLAGGSDSIVNEEALIALVGYCRGNPRIIDNVMSTALKYGSDLEYRTINGELMQMAISEQSLSKS